MDRENLTSEQLTALDDVLKWQREVEDAQNIVQERRVRLGRAIRNAFEEKVTVSLISEELEYSRARVYQLKNLAS